MTDTPRDHTPSSDEFGLEAVRELLRMIRETDVTEIQIERGAAKLHIKRGTTAPAPIMMTPAMMQAAMPAPAGSFTLPMQLAAFGHAPVAPGQAAEYEPPAGSQMIVSPMVGTYYASSSPKDPAYVREGDLIQPGDVVGIVEAMKIMNEVDSEVAGKISKILVTNGQPVEYGQPLMVIEST